MIRSRFRFERYLTFSLILCLLVASRMVLAPMLLEIERDLGLTHAVATSFFLVLSLGYAVSLLGSGFVAARLEHRDTILAGTAMGAAGLVVVALSRHLGLTYAGLFVMGAATGLYLPSGVASIYALAGDRERGKAIGVHEAGASFSFVLAPLLALAADGGERWRELLGALAAVSVALGLIHRFLGAGGRFRGEPPVIRNLSDLAANPEFRVTVVLFGLILGAGTGAFSVLPAFLVTERGMTQIEVNLVLSVSRLTGLPVAFLAGALADRVRPRVSLSVVLAGAGICTVLTGVARGPILLASLFLGPLLTGAFFPIAFALIPTIIPPGLRNLAVSMAMPFGYLVGAGVVPSLMGVLGEAGAFWVGYVVLGGLLVLGLGLVGRLGRAPAKGAMA